MELETELSKEDLVKLAECVNKILSSTGMVRQNPDMFKALYYDCTKCCGYNQHCNDYTAVKQVPTG